jgi:peptide/nickel transport system ATP-binding protein
MFMRGFTSVRDIWRADKGLADAVEDGLLIGPRPRFLICDELTSALDVSIQAQILNLLKDLQEELGLTMLFISHDLPVIRQMCNRVGVMRDGILCETNETVSLFEEPQHEYTKHLLDLTPKLEGLSHQGLELETNL